MNLALSVALLGGAIIDLDGTFFLQLGIFLAIFAMLNVLVFRPMLALMDARETATDGAKASARELETEAAEKLHAFETQTLPVPVGAGAQRSVAEQIRSEQRLSKTFWVKPNWNPVPSSVALTTTNGPPFRIRSP